MDQNAPSRHRVSVVLNCFNGAAFLREAVDSVLRQTFAGWELICWDDRSTDATAEILASYSDPRIRYLLAPVHTPLGAARHQAVHRAEGEWLAFLDQDDVWASDKLERQLALIDGAAGDLGLVYGRATRFGGSRTPRDYDHHHEFGRLPEGFIFDDLVRTSNFIAMSSAIVRRSAYFSVGGIPDHCHIVPDYLLFLAVTRTWRALALQEPCCWQRVHGANMSASTKLRSHEEALALIEQWRPSIDPAIYSRRVKMYQTLIGWEEIVGRVGLLRGAARILRRGSPGYLLARPLVRAFRWSRRVAGRSFAVHRAAPR